MLGQGVHPLQEDHHSNASHAPSSRVYARSVLHPPIPCVFLSLACDPGGPLLLCKSQRGQQLSFPVPESSWPAALFSLRVLFQPRRGPRLWTSALAPTPDPFSFPSNALNVKVLLQSQKVTCVKAPRDGFLLSLCKARREIPFHALITDVNAGRGLRDPVCTI